MMRKLIFLLAIFLMFGSVVVANVNDYNGSMVLLLHANQSPSNPTWFNDSSSQNHIFNTYVGATTNTTVKYLGNASGFFSGSLDRIDSPDSADWYMGTGNFTYMFWYKRNITGTIQTISGQGSAAGGSGSHTIAFDAANKIGLTIWYNAGANTETHVTTAAFADTSSWHQVVVTRAGNAVNIYVDGHMETLTSNTTAVTPDNSAQRFAVGSFGSYSASQTWGGLIDEYAIWKGVSIPISELYPQTTEIWTFSGTAPAAAFTGAPLTGHAPLSVTFTDASTGSPDSWNWTFGDGYVDNINQSPTHMYLSAGTYSINLSVGNAGGNNSLVRSNYVTVSNASELYPSFNVNISTGNRPLNVSFTNTSSNYNASLYSLFWQFGDGNTSTAADPTFTYNVPGTYLANLTLTNTSAPTNTSTSQTITVTIPSGFTQQDLVLTPSYVLTLTIRDSTTGTLIPSASVVDNLGNTYTTTNGTFYLTYPFSTVVLTVMSTGYTTKSVSYIIDSSQSQTVQLSPAGATPGQNVWWTPHIVQVTLFDSLTMNRLYEVNVTANYNQSSMPTEWVEQLYGIQATPAGQMVNKTLNLQGETGGDGTITFTMLGSLKYDMYLNSATYGLVNYHVAAYPSDAMLNLYVPTGSTLPVTKNSTLLALNNTRVYYYEPDIYNVTMCIDYIDTSGLTTTVTDIWMFTNNNTVIHSETFVPGVVMNTYCNTTRNVRGTSVQFWYNATRLE